MGEIKSVKVDNWGVFFLQKLQNFFNKTDYCDLTLQFRDNSQLKVHRLVLSACTDFFNVLEQTCELIDDALVMPIELQADVVVPIVNFMYTGTLEFELKMYSKLLKTAKEMNMTVLLKLLEAHKRTMDGSRPVRPSSPKSRGKRTGTGSPLMTKLTSSPSAVSSTQQTRRMITGQNATPWRRIVPVNESKVMPGTVFRQTTVSTFMKSPKMQRGPTRFETVDPNLHGDTYESSFDAISYESKPLKEEPEEYEERRSTPTKSRSSPFEQLRKGYNNNKRPAISTFTSPPAKKPNIEDVKEFSEQQRMRKQIAAEYGDDAEYDGILDDEFHNDDDDDEVPAGGSSSASAARQQQNQPQASIIIKQSPNEKPTIVVKDSSNSKMDHAKIISEVLRQYPHLVKSNKNIKLKIMPNVGGQTQKIVVKKEVDSTESEQNKAAGQQAARQQLQQLSQKQQLVLKTPAVKPEPQTTDESAAAAATPAPPQKRRIDSKTMHALIALGAENTTGPWLCLRCGINGRPISIPSYRGFRRHLINTHKETIDSALCEHCGWRSTSSRTLAHHIFVEHKIPSPLHSFPKCTHCSQICVDTNDLEAHVNQVHPEVHNQQCIYCNKIFSTEMQLYNHMKAAHKKRAREDGVIDFSDDEMDAEFEEDLKDFAPESTTTDKKIKIISDISLPSTILKLEEVPAQIEEEYANESGPKFVNADGNEMLLTAEQREEIMSQLDQDHEGGVVMVLNESTFPQGEAVVVGQEEGKLETTENVEEYHDHHIFTEFPPEAEAAASANDTSAEESALEVSKGGEEADEEQHQPEPQESEHDERMEEDHMEWAENVISAHDADEREEEEEEDDDEEDEPQAVKKVAVKVVTKKKEEKKVSSSKPAAESVKEEKKDTKKEDDISLKLKMLTGDWSDDEIDEEEDDANAEQNAKDATDEPASKAADTSTSEDVKKVLQETADDSLNKDEESIPEANPEEEDEGEAESKPTQSDEASNHDDGEEIKDEIADDEPETEVDTSKAQDPLPEPDTTTKVEVKRKLSTASGGSAPSRRTSAKDEPKQPAEEEKPLEKIETEVKTALRKKSGEEPLADAKEVDEENTSDEVKPDSKADKDETTVESESKPTNDDSLKTVDKVKSLISEWVDEEDDI